MAIDRRRRWCALAQSGREVGYDRLLLATGSRPFIIRVPGHPADGVIAVRDTSRTWKPCWRRPATIATPW
ncbi:hypothetical protein ACU4GD_40360 [Cupriavidus basilensis]